MDKNILTIVAIICVTILAIIIAIMGEAEEATIFEIVALAIILYARYRDD